MRFIFNFTQWLGSKIQYCDKVTCGTHYNEQVPDEMEVGHPFSDKEPYTNRVGDTAAQ